MGPEQKRLIDRRCNDPHRRLVNFNIFPGERQCTAEELCAELNSAFDQVDSGASVPSAIPSSPALSLLTCANGSKLSLNK